MSSKILLNSHITISFDIEFIKIYKKDNYFVLAHLGEGYDVSKSKSSVECAGFVFEQIKGIPIIDLVFFYNKLKVSKCKKIKINKLIQQTHDELLTIAIIKRYIDLLF